jgi:hypothetical protein
MSSPSIASASRIAWPNEMSGRVSGPRFDATLTQSRWMSAVSIALLIHRASAIAADSSSAMPANPSTLSLPSSAIIAPSCEPLLAAASLEPSEGSDAAVLWLSACCLPSRFGRTFNFEPGAGASTCPTKDSGAMEPITPYGLGGRRSNSSSDDLPNEIVRFVPTLRAKASQGRSAL